MKDTQEKLKPNNFRERMLSDVLAALVGTTFAVLFCAAWMP